MYPILKLEGLPFKVTTEELHQFFADCDVKEVYLVKDCDERPSGLGFVELETPELISRALAKNGKNIASHNRYLKASLSTRDQMQWYKNCKLTRHIMEVNNLPFRLSQYEIACWLGLPGCSSVCYIKNEAGKNSGSADACFLTEEDMKEAFKKNNGSFNGRTIRMSLPPPEKFPRFFLLLSQLDFCDEDDIKIVCDCISTIRRGPGSILAEFQSWDSLQLAYDNRDAIKKRLGMETKIQIWDSEVAAAGISVDADGCHTMNGFRAAMARAILNNSAVLNRTQIDSVPLQTVSDGPPRSRKTTVHPCSRTQPSCGYSSHPH
jgi:hypothetical protein